MASAPRIVTVALTALLLGCGSTGADGGLPPDSAIDSSADTGSPAGDADRVPDGGANDASALADTGSRPVDAGAPMDTASTPVDSGTPTDTGSRSVDAGAPTDAGTTPIPADPDVLDVGALYVEYFGRPADPAGLQHFLTELASARAGGASRDDALVSLSAEFATAAEFTLSTAGMSSDQTVGLVYRNLFGHEPDPAGLAYWSLRLSSGAITVGQMVRAIAESSLRSGLADGIALTNKIHAAAVFTAAIDTPVETFCYVGESARAYGRRYLAAVTNDASYATATAPAALSATIAAIPCG